MHNNWVKYNLPRYLEGEQNPPRKKKRRGEYKYNLTYLELIKILENIQATIFVFVLLFRTFLLIFVNSVIVFIPTFLYFGIF